MRDLKLYKGGTLTKTNNKNIEQPYPICQDTKWDMDSDVEVNTSEQNSSLGPTKL